MRFRTVKENEMFESLDKNLQEKIKFLFHPKSYVPLSKMIEITNWYYSLSAEQQDHLECLKQEAVDNFERNIGD